MAAAGGAAGSPPPPPAAALLWFRPGDLRLSDHEPLFAATASLQQGLQRGQEGGPAPLLLPFCCIDERELAAAEGSLLGLPALGPHRLRLLLEACASLRASLRQLGSDLAWAQGRPEALVGRLVALAAAAGSRDVSLYHYRQAGCRPTGVEGSVQAAFRAAAAERGMSSSVHAFWGATLYHPDDLPYAQFAAGSSGAAGMAPPVSQPASVQQQQQQQQQQPQQPGPGSGPALDPQRFACLPETMSDFRRVLQAHTPVRKPLPPPVPAGGNGGSGSSGSGAPVLPLLPPTVAALAAEAGLLNPLPAEVGSVYASAGPAAQQAVARLEGLTGLRCAGLAPAGSGRHDPRSALPFTMGEEQALQRLRYYLGLEPSQGLGSRRAAPIESYQETRMTAVGVDSSAKLSAFLSLGCLSPRTVHAEAMRLAASQGQEPAAVQQSAGVHGAAPAAGAAGEACVEPPWREPHQGDTWRWLLMHLGIRDYFVYLFLSQEAALREPGGLSGRQVEWRQDAELFAKWAHGQTGLPFVDACMRELATTGYMSNRGRQNCANFLSKGLSLDWRLGCELFECLLADAETPLNAGNWAYNSGVGTDPRDRGFKVVSQGLRYDPDARLVTAWLPELADLQHVQPGGGPELAHQPWLASPQALAAAGLRLGQRPPVAAAEAAAGGESAAEERRSWYPEPLVDPALQTAKGPKRPPQRQ